MRLFSSLILVVLCSCKQLVLENIPLEFLEKVELSEFRPNYTFPEKVDSLSLLLHQSLLKNNTWDNIQDLDVYMLFKETEGLTKYYQTGWQNEKNWLVLGTNNTKLSYLLMITKEGILHDAVEYTHYMPGPVYCDYDRRKPLKFDMAKGEFVLQEIYGEAIGGSDSCERVVIVDSYRITEQAYFEHLNRQHSVERHLKKN